MIPVNEIIPHNLYSQDDAGFLLGEGFTKKAAREAICAACRSGDLRNAQWRKRYWFSGRSFVEWVRGWFGAGPPSIPPQEIDGRAPRRKDTPLRLGACPPVAGKEVSR